MTAAVCLCQSWEKSPELLLASLKQHLSWKYSLYQSIWHLYDKWFNSSSFNNDTCIWYNIFIWQQLVVTTICSSFPGEKQIASNGPNVLSDLVSGRQLWQQVKMHRSDVVKIQIDTFMLICFSLNHLKKFSLKLKKIVKGFFVGGKSVFPWRRTHSWENVSHHGACKTPLSGIRSRERNEMR